MNPGQAPSGSTHETAPVTRVFKPDGLRIEGGAIAEITTFDASLFPAFELPPTL